jgi:Fe-S cluster assembly protein SufD
MTGAVETAGTLAQPNVLAAGPVWLREIREQARDRFNALGYPNTRNEEWKYTNVAPIAQMRFQAGEYRIDGEIADLAERLTLGVEAITLVFINGRYSSELSNRHESYQGKIRASGLQEALQNGNHRIQQYLERDRTGSAPFVALNTASIEDGAFVELADGLVLDRPIHLIFLSAVNGAPSACHPRNLILAGAQSQVSIVETYAGLEGEVYFTNSVTDIVVGENSVIKHHKFQKESSRGFHIATLRFEQERNSNVSCYSFSFGGALVRNDINVTLAEGAEGTLDGLYLASGKQHVDNHTTIDHAKPHAASRELYKGILDGRSSAVFNGKVIVRKDAQKTDAKQTNRNLLLSGDAVINTKPELQIYADDVRCTHGATIGQLDENALFYLRSRGIGQNEARQILVHAFAHEIIGRVKLDGLRGELEKELDARLRSIGSEIS